MVGWEWMSVVVVVVLVVAVVVAIETSISVTSWMLQLTAGKFLVAGGLSSSAALGWGVDLWWATELFSCLFMDVASENYERPWVWRHCGMAFWSFAGLLMCLLEWMYSDVDVCVCVCVHMSVCVQMSICECGNRRGRDYWHIAYGIITIIWYHTLMQATAMCVWDAWRMDVGEIYDGENNLWARRMHEITICM